MRPIHHRSDSMATETSPGENPSLDCELLKLLAPVKLETFLFEYWQEKSMFIKGAPTKFQDIFDRQRFYKAIACADKLRHVPSFQILAMMPNAEDDVLAATSMNMARIDPADIDDLLAQGITICVNDISAADEELAAYARNIKAQMLYTGPVRFNCYLSPANSGADMHFDARASTTLQLEGSKRWLFARSPALTWPLSNAQCGYDGSPIWALPWAGREAWEQLAPIDEVPFAEVVLEPGDVLYLPAGTWHDVKATATGSLALNLSFGTLGFFNLLTRVLEPFFLQNAAWRAGPPPVVGTAMLSEEVPAEVAQYLLQRLGELRSFIEMFDPKDERVQRVWRNLTH